MKQSATCPKCGSIVTPDDIFCPQCGHQLKVEFYERLLPLFRRVPPSEIRPLSFIGKIKSFFIRPQLVYHDYMLSVRSFLPFLIVLFNVFLSVLYFEIIFFSNVPVISDLTIIEALISGLIIFFVNFIYTFIYFAVIALIAHLIVRLYEGHGKFKLTLNMTFISSFPLVIHKLIMLLFFMITPLSVQGSLTLSVESFFESNAWILSQSLEIPFYVWMVILFTIGLRVGHKISTQDALIASIASISLILLLRSFL